MVQTTQLYRDATGCYWFGTPDGLAPLAPSASEFLQGVKASLEYAAAVSDEVKETITISLHFVDLVPLSEVAGATLVTPDLAPWSAE